METYEKGVVETRIRCQTPVSKKSFSSGLTYEHRTLLALHEKYLSPGARLIALKDNFGRVPASSNAIACLPH